MLTTKTDIQKSDDQIKIKDFTKQILSLADVFKDSITLEWVENPVFFPNHPQNTELKDKKIILKEKSLFFRTFEDTAITTLFKEAEEKYKKYETLELALTHNTIDMLKADLSLRALVKISEALLTEDCTAENTPNITHTVEDVLSWHTSLNWMMGDSAQLTQLNLMLNRILKFNHITLDLPPTLNNWGICYQKTIFILQIVYSHAQSQYKQTYRLQDPSDPKNFTVEALPRNCALCPFTRLPINKNDKQSAVLFMDVFLLAIETAIKNYPVLSESLKASDTDLHKTIIDKTHELRNLKPNEKRLKAAEIALKKLLADEKDHGLHAIHVFALTKHNICKANALLVLSPEKVRELRLKTLTQQKLDSLSPEEAFEFGLWLSEKKDPTETLIFSFKPKKTLNNDLLTGIKNNDFNAVKTAIDSGATALQKAMTVLHKKSNADIVKLLQQEQQKRNEQLIEAILEGNLLKVNKALEGGADINSVSSSKWGTYNALQLAIVYEKKEIALLLLSKEGIDLNHKNQLGDTTLDLAKDFQDKDVIEKIEKLKDIHKMNI